MTPQEKDLLPKAGEDPALKAPPKKDLVQSARDFLGNAFGGKNTDLNATVEQFTAEMTLVAEGLRQDQTRLSEQADRLSAQQTLLEEDTRVAIGAVQASLNGLNKRLDGLEKRMDHLEKQVQDKKLRKVDGWTGLVRQATWLVGLLAGVWIVTTVLKLFA